MRYQKAWTMFLPFSLLFLFINADALCEIVNPGKGAAAYGRMIREARETNKVKTTGKGARNGWMAFFRNKLEEKAIPFEAEEFIGFIQRGDRETAGYFLLAGMSPNATDQDGTPALIWAVRSDHIELVRLLIFCSKHNAELAYEDVEVDGRDRGGETALMWALKNGHDEIAELLIIEGADFDTLQNRDGDTALEWTAAHGNIDLMKLMLKEGAKVSAKNAAGETPLMLAATNGHHAIVGLLLRNGAIAEAKNRKGKTALELAKENHRKRVVRLLSDESLKVDPKTRRSEWIRKQREEFPSRIYIPLSWRDEDKDEFITERFDLTVIRPTLILMNYLQTEVDYKKNFSQEWIAFKNKGEVPSKTLPASGLIDNTKTFGCVNKKMKELLENEIDISCSEAAFFDLAINLKNHKAEGITLCYHGGRFGSIDSIAYIGFLEEPTSIILNKPFILDRFVCCQEYYIQSRQAQLLDDILDVDGLCDHMNSCRPDPSVGVRLGTEFLNKISYEIDEEHQVLVIGK